jgi:2-methylcitrate dehydratase PrpD
LEQEITMKNGSDQDGDLTVSNTFHVTRRSPLQTTATGGLASVGTTSLAEGASRKDKREPDSPNLALALSRLFLRTTFGTVPPTAIDYAKMIIASTLASAASGTLIDSARIVRELAREHGGRPEATVWFDPLKLPVAEAVRVNAMLSDAAAFDDSDLRNVAHTGTAVTAIGLAIGESTNATGRDVLCAMVTGYEAAGRFGDAVKGGRPGLHPSMIVAFGAVVAAGKLLKLTPEQMANAICITAVTMGGLQLATYTCAREYQGGNAALCAGNAALAARRGFVVQEDMLEAKGGFLEVYGNPKVDIKSLTRDPGLTWDIEKYLAIKMVPGAHAMHPTMEAAVNAARQANLQPEQVAKILISGPPKWAVTYTQTPPKDMVEAIHSLPYFVASAVADKDFSFISLTPEKIHNPVVAQLMKLVEVDPAPPPVHYDFFWGGTVTIITKSGARYTSTVDAPRGSGPRGIEWSDVDIKYRNLMPDSGLPAKRVEEILDVIHDFDQVKDVSQFMPMLHRHADSG